MEICGHLEDLMVPFCRENRHDPNVALITQAIHLTQEAITGTNNPRLVKNVFSDLKGITIRPQKSTPRLVQKLLLQTMRVVLNGGNGAKTSKLKSILDDAEEAVFVAMGAAI